MLRVFRIFKVGKYSSNLQVIVRTFRSSTEALSLLVFLIGVALTVFSTAMFYAEQVDQRFDEKTQLWMRNDGRIR